MKSTEGIAVYIWPDGVVLALDEINAEVASCNEGWSEGVAFTPAQLAVRDKQIWEAAREMDRLVESDDAGNLYQVSEDYKYATFEEYQQSLESKI